MKRKYLGVLTAIIMMTSFVGCGNTESKVDSGVSAEQKEKEEKSGDNEIVEKSEQIKKNYINYIEKVAGDRIKEEVDFKEKNSYEIQLDFHEDIFEFFYRDSMYFMNMNFGENSDGDSVFKGFTHKRQANLEEEIEWLEETKFKFTESYFPEFFKEVFEVEFDWAKIDEEIKDMDLRGDRYFIEKEGYQLGINESHNSLTIILTIANSGAKTEYEEVYLLESE
ncbi:hypothetical protein [uncultured Clostridium sp.]|uniref:hypothetical protein n=1 Tax=uncultured Clostridium sp. TaxID=59620 RepID=UPI0026360C41|nr:hypothetical protein [uncultured Clostridium sp.]